MRERSDNPALRLDRRESAQSSFLQVPERGAARCPRKKLVPRDCWNLLEFAGVCYRLGVTKEMEALERLIDRLSREVRRAMASGDRDRASWLRAELREARQRWDE